MLPPLSLRTIAPLSRRRHRHRYPHFNYNEFVGGNCVDHQAFGGKTSTGRSYHSKYYGCASSSRCLKVTVLNATEHTGRILSLCLKQSPIIDELAIYDACAPDARSMMLDLSLMSTRCRTYDVDDQASGEAGLKRVLDNAKIVVFVSDRGKALEQDALNLHLYVPWILAYCPKAFVAVVTNWTNSLVPMIFELYKRAGLVELAASRLFGVTSLFSTRANSYAAELLGLKPEFVNVPVIGGSDAASVVPLFSRTQPSANFTTDELARLQSSIKYADDRVCAAYRSSLQDTNAGGDWDKRSSAVCAGYSAARFCNSLCKAIRAEAGVVECAYTRSNLLVDEGVKYFGAPLELGSCGIQRHLGVSKLSNSECRTLYSVLPQLKAAIARGECLAERKPPGCLPEEDKAKKKDEEEDGGKGKGAAGRGRIFNNKPSS